MKAIEKALSKKFNYDKISENTDIYAASRFKREFKEYIKQMAS
jgi:hypothetical protein